MQYNIKVITNNPSKNNNGGYHEIHDIKYLSSPQHAFVTIENIITNNKAFGDNDCELTGVDVYCNDIIFYNLLRKYYLSDKIVTVIFE